MATRFAPLAPEDPREVGGYVLRARLGAGGMGRVYLGFTRGGHALAIKVIRPEHADNEQFRRRFEREVAAAQRVQGLFTAPVVAADPKARLPWLATAYVPGPSLRQAVDDHGPLPLPTVFRLVAGVAEGLAAVHASGVIHRDLTPANVLLAADGPRVIDFGIAHAVDTSLTATGVQIGTPAFMTPEQVLNLPITPATDVFALGHLAVFAATGRPAFGEGNAVFYRIGHESPNLAGCPAELHELAIRCLAKDPARRPGLTEITDYARERTSGHTLQFADSWLPTAVADSLTSYDTPKSTRKKTRTKTAPKRTIRTKDRAISVGDRFAKTLAGLTTGIVGGVLIYVMMREKASNQGRPAGCDEAFQSVDAYSSQVEGFRNQPYYSSANGATAMEQLAAGLNVAAGKATDSDVISTLQKLAVDYSTAASYIRADYSLFQSMEPALRADYDAVVAACQDDR